VTTEREAAEQRLAEELGFRVEPREMGRGKRFAKLRLSEGFSSMGKEMNMAELNLYGRAVALSVENARLKEALQEVRSDIARAHTNNVIWPNTIRMLEEIACQK